MAQNASINIGVNGIAQARQQLRDFRGELLNATDPAEIQRLSQAAGQLADQLNDVNEQVALFAGGSDFEVVSNGLGLVGDQLSNLDFEGAANSARLLATRVATITPQSITQGFAQFRTAIGQLGTAFVTFARNAIPAVQQAFVNLGRTLLANPLYLFAAIVAAVVISIILLKDKIKILQVAFDVMMIPIRALIQGLKDLSDWIGLTTYASDEAADKIIENNERISDSIARQGDVNAAEFARQIAEAKARGEDTTDIEEEAYESRIKTAEEFEQKKLDTYNNYKVKYLNAVKTGNDDEAKEIIEAGQKAYDAYQVAIQATANALSERDQYYSKQQTKRIQDGFKAESDAINASITAMKEGLPRELAQIRQNYSEKRDQLARDLTIDSDIKIKLGAALNLKEQTEINNAIEKNQKAINDKKKTIQKKYQDDVIAVMDEGFEKEFAKNELKLKRDLEDLDNSYKELKKLRGDLTDDEINDYKNSRAQLAVISKQVEDKLYNDELERLKTLRKQKVAERQKEIEEIENILKENRQKVLDINQNTNDLILKSDAEAEKERRSNIIAAYAKARGELKTAMFLELAAFEGNEIEKTKIKEKYAKKRAELDESETKALAQKTAFFGENTQEALNQAVAISDAFSSLLGGINALQQQQAQQRLNDLEKELTTQNNLLDEQRKKELSQTDLSENQKNAINKKYDQLKYKNELAAFQKSEEIKKAAFKKDKAFRIAQAVMSTASAAVNALGSVPFPANIVVAGLMAALGAVQIAAISGQKYEGEAGPSAPSMTGPTGGLGGNSEAATPSFNLFGNGNQNAGTASQQDGPAFRNANNITVTAVVSEVQMTETQGRVNRIQQSAEL